MNTQTTSATNATTQNTRKKNQVLINKLNLFLVNFDQFSKKVILQTLNCSITLGKLLGNFFKYIFIFNFACEFCPEIAEKMPTLFDFTNNAMKLLDLLLTHVLAYLNI